MFKKSSRFWKQSPRFYTEASKNDIPFWTSGQLQGNVL